MSDAPPPPGRGAAEPPPPVVLVVDDVAEINAMMTQELLDAGYRTVQASNGREGLERLLRETPDLVLLDVEMPEMNGLEFLERMRARPELRLVPVIVLTAHRETSMKVRAMDLGADDFLSKPFVRDELLARVRAHLRLRSLTLALERERRRLKDALDKLKAAQARLVETETQKARAELLNQVAVTLGHQINNPLTGLFGFADELCEDAATPDTREIGANMRKGLERIGSIVEKLQNIKDPKVIPYYRDLNMLDLDGEEDGAGAGEAS